MLVDGQRTCAASVWADVEDGAGHSVANPDGGFEGRLDNVPIEFHHRTVSIAGLNYQLADGSLFSFLLKSNGQSSSN